MPTMPTKEDGRAAHGATKSDSFALVPLLLYIMCYFQVDDVELSAVCDAQ